MSPDSAEMNKTFFKEERFLWIVRPAHGYSMILVDPPSWEYSVINSGDTSFAVFIFPNVIHSLFIWKGLNQLWTVIVSGGKPLLLRANYYIVDCCEFSVTFLWSTLWWPRAEADHGQNLCGSPFSFSNHLQVPKLTGNEAVGRERKSEEGLERGGEKICMGLLVIRRFKLWKKLINNETSDWMMQIMKTGFVSSCN